MSNLKLQATETIEDIEKVGIAASLAWHIEKYCKIAENDWY